MSGINVARAPVWQINLPKCGGHVVNLLADVRGITMGCNGEVFRVEAGQNTITQHNNLPGTFYQEVRLAVFINPGVGNISVGTNGAIAGLDLRDITTDPPGIFWIQPGSSSPLQPNIVSVVQDLRGVIAGCNGSVFGCDPDKVRWVQDLGAAVGQEVRLALYPPPAGSSESLRVLVGTSGFVSSIAYTWNSSPPSRTDYRLPENSRGSVVDVLPIDDGKHSFYAGCHGYVYRVNADSNIVTNNLPGLKFYEVRLAAVKDKSGDILVGTNGAVLRLDGVTLQTKWQTTISDANGLPVSVICTDTGVFAGSDGKVFFLGAAAGDLLWQGALDLPPVIPVPPYPPFFIPTTDTRLAAFGNNLVAGCYGAVGLFTVSA
jgi:hypothetical protein